MELDVSKIKKTVEWSKEDQTYIARAPEFPGCAAHGDSEAEALKHLNDAIVVHLEAMAEMQLEKADGQSKFLLRLPGKIKAIVAKIANDKDLSMNELLVKYISRGLESHMKRDAQETRNLSLIRKSHKKTEKKPIQHATRKIQMAARVKRRA